MSLSKCQNRVSEEEAPMKQGIVAILGSDVVPKAASIRRTLSADMSSKKWLEQNGMKTIVSSEELIKLPPATDHVLESNAEDQKSPPLMDVWTSILVSRKTDGNPCLPPPYVHSLTKTSSSGLSEKSLEICTESLGSETGSECFSSYAPSEGSEDRITGLEEELKEETQFEERDSFCAAATARCKESPARPSPPLIRCISGEYGPTIHMNSRRENGRLVVEAVSVPPRNCFQTKRCDGRLVLSLIHVPAMNPEMAEDDDDDNDGVADFKKVFNDIEEAQEEVNDSGGDEDDDEVAEEELFALERPPPYLEASSHKPPVAIKNLVAIGHRNRKASAAAVEEKFTVPQSLPPPPRVPRLIPTTASFNAYDYFWRNMSATAGGGSKNKRQTKNQHLEVVVMNPYLKGCKDRRRSLLIWEPFHCIATT